MASKEYKYRQELKKALQSVLSTIPQAKEVRYRYNTLRATLLKFYPNLIGSIEKEVFLEMLRATIYLDRQIRLQTEGIDEEEKEILSQEKQVELGYTPNFTSDVRKLKQI